MLITILIWTVGILLSLAIILKIAWIFLKDSCIALYKFKEAEKASIDYFRSEEFNKDLDLEFSKLATLSDFYVSFKKAEGRPTPILETKKGRSLYKLEIEAHVSFLEKTSFIPKLFSFWPLNRIKTLDYKAELLQAFSYVEDPILKQRILNLIIK